MKIFLISVFLSAALFCPAHAVTLEQVISRESPLYSNRDSELTVGRDGMVYLHSQVIYNGYAVRLTREGNEKSGGDTGPKTGNVAANADGIIAAANQHFAHTLALYDKDLNRFAGVSDFRIVDKRIW